MMVAEISRNLSCNSSLSDPRSCLTEAYVLSVRFVCSVLENLGCKVMVMKMMTHNDPNVRKEALLAVQKLMVHNW